MSSIEITKGQVLRYALLPQVLPRFRGLISSGFANLAYFMALVYRATNILPSNHVYLKSSSVGKYTIRNVLVEAANNLTFNLKHIDQIIIFFALIAGIFILILQFFFLLLAIFINPSFAGDSFPTGIGEFFLTPQPEQDLALRMLDSVFGIPEIFGSIEPKQTEFHQALQGLFQLYSFGLLVVAVIIIIYFIFAILAETAQSGTPFGKRYNQVWAPIRLVVGVGMLVPVTLGFNSAQWITLYAAKFGSGFATTGWIIFNETIDDHYLDTESLVAEPEVPELKDIVALNFIAKACRHAYRRTADFVEGGTEGNNADIFMWVIQNEDGGIAERIEENNYAEAVELSNGGDIHIRIGQFNNNHAGEIANVYPYCGDIVLQNPEPIKTVRGALEVNLNGSQILNERYYELIRTYWLGDHLGITTNAEAFMERRIGDLADEDPDAEYKEFLIEEAKIYVEEVIEEAVQATIEDEFSEEEVPGTRYIDLGWGGAALWYNKIANANGKLTTAAINKPQVKAYPAAMTYTCKENQQQNANTSPKDCYDPNLASGRQVQYLSKVQENVANGLSDAYDYWYKDPNDETGNVFVDVINAVLGIEGLFTMCKNTDIHPLAQLSSLGKGMIEAAIRNLGISLGTGAGGILSGYFGPLLTSASSFFSTVASIGILIGFILFYVVPFLPFLYFMFAVGGWVKGLFEAMVGVPLWALAHLRIDGEGLPGDAAVNGYFLVFEIFLRPILIVFGLIASILVFGAMVKVLNQTFTLIVSNLSGFDPNDAAAAACQSEGPTTAEPGTIEWMRGPIDELFFTIVYAIIVYMTGMASFKMIDLVPNNILRWMGQGVQTFNDQSGEPAEGLLSKVAIGGGMLTQNLQIAGNLGQAVGGFKRGIPEAARNLTSGNSGK